jgi:membrane glycosyltransferase
MGLLLIPEETAAPVLPQDQKRALEMEQAASERIEREELFDAALEDPVFHALHISILHATESHRTLDKLEFEQIERAFKEFGSAGLTLERRRALLCDADALRELHIWTRSRPERARAVTGARVGTLA